MTGHQINSLVGDLVAMAQAMERLPQVEAELADARNVLVEMDKAQDSLKSDLEQSRSYAASLEAKVRETEASRDDAELRFLELDEKIHLANGFVGSVEVVLGQLKAQLAFPAPQPEPIISKVKSIEPVPGSLHELVVGFDDPPHHGDLEADAKDYHASQPSQGQSEADPTGAPTETTLSQDAPSTNAESKDTASSSWADPSPPKPQPYTDIRYDNWPKYVSLTDWIDGGGTEASYYV